MGHCSRSASAMAVSATRVSLRSLGSRRTYASKEGAVHVSRHSLGSAIRSPPSLPDLSSLSLHESACCLLVAGVQSGLRRKELSAPAPIYQGLHLAEPQGRKLRKLGWGVSSTHQGRS